MEGLAALYAAARERIAPVLPAPMLAGLPEAPPPERGLSRSPTPGTAAIREAVPGPGEEALLARAVALADRLAWRQSYTAAEIGESYVRSSGYVEMLGRRGHFGAAGTAFGLGVIGRDAFYPAHRHPAEEVYLPIAGRGAWQVEDRPWRRAGPGEPVRMAPRAWHAIRTGETVLVYLYAWHGGDPSVPSEIRGLG
jgi:hypothetical protein